MPFDFEGKRILITGGSRGIGRAAAAAFLRAGGRVALNGRSPASTEAGMAALRDAVPTSGPGDARPVAAPGDARLVAAPGDVATVAGCTRAVEAALAGLGGLDVLVACAGVGASGPIDATDEAAWDRIVDVNLKGTFFAIRAALDALRASGGNVVTLGSDAGLLGEAGLSAYCAAKGGVVNLTRALALELAPEIRVNCVCPGYVDTDMVRRDGIERAADPAAAERALIDRAPLRRIARPDEIAAAILYLASDAARFVTGAALQIDGGTTAGQPKPV